MKRIFRVMALLMAFIILISYPLQVSAAGLEGAILGGGAGLAMSVPEVAILLLAAFGVCYTVENADAIGDSLVRALEFQAEYEETQTEMTGMQLELLADWWAEAQTGAIDLASAPSWITNSIKEWASGFILGKSSIAVPDSNAPIYEVPSGTVSCVGYVISQPGNDYRIGYWDYDSYGNVTFVSHDWFVCSVPNTKIQYWKYGEWNDFYNLGYLTIGSNRYAYAVSSNGRAFVSPSSSNYQTFLTEAANYMIVEEGYSIVDIISGSYVFTVDLYPDVLTGGIVNQVSSGVDMSVIGLPDVVIPGPDVFPVDPSEYEDEAAAVTDYITAGLISGELTWEEYWKLIGVYGPTTGTASPTVTLENTDAGTVTGTYELTDTGVAEIPVAIPVAGDYTIDLTEFFPFCLPFDIYAFFELLAAEPEAPRFEWEIQLPVMDEPYLFVVDLSPWNDIAQLLRNLELIAFIIGLCVVTREKFLRS